MKTINLNDETIQINREIVSKIGEIFYRSSGVESVLIKIDFKDGSYIGFNREELEDDVKRRIGEKNE